ncbi:reticulocyte-binding protein homolog 2a-like [Dermacentor albipictus]|uniref:reticulocyte-binding protein homolog 2a-like n=1 Tax=Dermacentor albipictus TaxID=60249 RepID=UPI0038FC8EBE
MDLRRLTRLDLLLVCDDLGVEADERMETPAIIKAINDSGNDDKSIALAWEVIQEPQERVRRVRLRERRELRSERQREERENERKQELQELALRCERHGRENEREREREEKYEREKAALIKEIQYCDQLLAQRQRLSENSVNSTERKYEEASSRFSPEADEKSSACEIGCRLISKGKRLAANDALVAIEAVKGQSESDEVLCQQMTVETARPAANKLAQLPRVCVAGNVSEVASEGKGTVDATDASTHVEPDVRAEVKCELSGAVEGNSEDCELRSSREYNCIVQGSVRLSASLGSLERDDSVINHSDCARETAIDTDGLCADSQRELGNVVEGSSQECELSYSSKACCIVPESVELSASRGKVRVDLNVNHSDCAGKRPIRADEMCTGQHEAREGDMKASAKRKRLKKKRRKDRKSVINVAPPKMARNPNGQGARKKVRSSRTMLTHPERSSHRSKGDREECSARTRTKGTRQLSCSSFRSSFHSSACSWKKRKVAGRDQVGSSDAVNRVRVESGARGRKLAVDRNVLGELIVNQPFCCLLAARVAFRPRPPRVRLKV